MTLLTAAPVLVEPLQELIDARLDTIERMLLGRVPRSDRLAIVNEVESQIHELLGDRDPQLLTSDDVLEVLRRLDPPEAYLSNNPIAGDAQERPPVRRPATLPAAPAAARPAARREGVIGGILGLSALGSLLLAVPLYLIAVFAGSEIILFVGLGFLCLITIVSSICGFIFSIRGRRDGVLPILGMIAAPLTFMFWMLGGSWLMLALMS
ncbi:MAG TPA: hypothetical protein VHB77_15240 [Planctomycetaceae bacterium]|nr:hypothetical protein [Planctomycetaceae bacterium]